MSRSAAPVTKSHPPTSPNTAPATQNECHQWSAAHMKRHFQCVEQVKSPSNLTKCCACHAKWMSSMICVTYETSFPMRGASKVTLQPHQILRLPRNLEAQDFSGNSLKCFRQYKDDSTISEHNPTIKSSSRTRRFGELTRPILEAILYCKIQHFASRLSPKMSRSAAPVTKSHPPTSPNTAPATQNCACHTKWTLNYELWLNCDWTVTLLNCCFTELWLYWTVTLLNCYFTELWLYWIVTVLNCDCTVTVLNCDFTELLLYWIVTVLNCDCTELWLYWTVTLLNRYFTELLLYWTVTLLNCYFTDLWLYWTVTLLNCYFTELLLYWTVTLLNCYFTELLLYWTITLLDCYFTELLLYWTVTLLNRYFYWIFYIFFKFVTRKFLIQTSFDKYKYYYKFLSICMPVSTSHIPISSEIPGFLHSKFLSTWMSKPCLLSPNPGQRSTSTHGKSSWLVFVCKNSAKGAGVSCETELMNGETWIRWPCVDRQRNR